VNGKADHFLKDEKKHEKEQRIHEISWTNTWHKMNNRNLKRYKSIRWRVKDTTLGMQPESEKQCT
jgi:hypothetical protein